MRARMKRMRELLERKTVRVSELLRSDPLLPQVIEIDGTRYRWVGIGWVPEGPATGDEVLVMDD